MTLVLPYLLVLVAVAGVLFGIACLLFGRGETLPPLPRAATLTELPAHDVSGDDVRALRFRQSLRGYDTAEVDWALARLAAELDALRAGRSEALPPAQLVGRDDPAGPAVETSRP